MNPYTEVLFEERQGKGGNLGIITLNRPTVLNALNLTMIDAMTAQLQLWANMEEIKAVIIRAAPGRAFCAGGDLRAVYEAYRKHEHVRNISAFFRKEYQLNSLIFHYTKPFIAFLDGITMGGGAGISILGSHRVATEHLLFAMPETGIGFFPDIGASYFLSRLPNKMGYYLGLTGTKLSSDDCVHLRLAQFKVASCVLPAILDTLAANEFTTNSKQFVNDILHTFQKPLQPAVFSEHWTFIDKSFSHQRMEEILQTLATFDNPFTQEVIQTLYKKSPTSLKVTLQAFLLGEKLSFDECMRQDFRLTSRFLEGHDFYEGIRAIIIDKDQKPHWQPDTLEKVTSDIVESYFQPLTVEL